MVYTNQFEKVFEDFLNRPVYDKAESALFDLVRAAFEAGWKAASDGEECCVKKTDRTEDKRDLCT